MRRVQPVVARWPAGSVYALAHVLAVALTGALLLALASTAARAQSAGAPVTQRGASGLPLPRFVSLKAQPVNLRKGPGTQFPIAWVMTFAGTPLEITREYGDWREVRDVDGTSGWILGTLLSGRRTAVVRPWDRRSGVGAAAASAPLVDLRSTASSRGSVAARLEAGAIVSVKSCDTQWCAAAVSGFSGYVEQKSLWGVYPGERFQ